MATFFWVLLLLPCPPDLLLSPSRIHHKTFLSNQLLFELQKQDYAKCIMKEEVKSNGITKQLLKAIYLHRDVWQTRPISHLRI
jgi:hypothetical protein